MSTLKEFSHAIDRFLQDQEAGVLSIKGHWGVGKTYAWRQYLSKIQERSNDFPSLKQKHYAYASLFGQNSIQDIKSTLFGSIVPIFPGDRKHFRLIKKYAKHGLENFDFSGIPFLKSIKGTEQLAQIILERSVKDLVICFDDLDRKEPKLTDSAFLGLVTGLRDLKNCKIILLYNDEVVEQKKDESATGFNSFMEYREKVIDHEFAFRQSTKECFRIAFKDNKLGIDVNNSEQSVTSGLRTDIEGLGLSNIRILKKVRSALEYFREELAQQYPKTIEQHQKQIAKLCAIYFRHGNELSLEQILSYSVYQLVLDSEKDEKDPEEQKMLNILKKYDYFRLEFDTIIADYLRNGYVNLSYYEQFLADLEKREGLDELQTEHSKYWHGLEGNFLISGNEFICQLKVFLDQHYDSIDLFSMESSLRAINEVGGQIDVLDYMNKKIHSIMQEIGSIRAIRKESHRGPKELIQHCEKVYSEGRKPLPLPEVVSKMTVDGGWDPKDAIDLEPLTENHFYDWFTTATDADLLRKIQELRWILPQCNNGTEILARIDSALRRIADRSKIDKLRVRKYIGEDVFDHAPETPNPD